MEYRQVLQAGTVLDGKYRIERVLGSGGFGITYEAFDLKLAAPVAIKEYFPSQFGVRDATYSVRPRSAGDREIFDRLLSSFLREARTLNQFEHPAIVRVLNVFEAHGTAYMVMKYENGPSLKAWLGNLARLPTQAELDRLTVPLLDALEMMHNAEFLHRDIAPDNIIVRADATPVLLDFGASRRIMGEMTGTLTGVVKKGYSPQEQYATDGRSQGPWTDIYALGATLYRCISGEIPDEATERMLEDRVTPAVEAGEGRYRPAFLAAIDAAMVPRPKDRPQSIAVWRGMLFDGVPIVAVGPPSWPTVGGVRLAGSAYEAATSPRMDAGPSTASGPRSAPPLHASDTVPRASLSDNPASARRTEPNSGPPAAAGAAETSASLPVRRRKLGVAMAAAAVALLGGGALLLQTSQVGPRLTTAQTQAGIEETPAAGKREEEWRRAAEEARRQHEAQIERATREAARRAAEETRKQLEEEARQRAADAARRAAEETRREIEEEARQRDAEAARQRAAEEARQRKLAEEAEARRRVEEARQQAAEAARRQAEEEARKRELAEEMEARRKAEEAHRLAVLDAERRAAEGARQRKLAEEAEAARHAAEEARKRQEAQIARLTREAAERAEQETRRRLLEEARKREAADPKPQAKEEPTRVASLPKVPNPAPSTGSFDGTWRIAFTATSPKCHVQNGNFFIVVSQLQVTRVGRRGVGSGRVSPTGRVTWSAPARFGPRLLDWTGTLRGNSGSGTYAVRGGACTGRFTASRG